MAILCGQTSILTILQRASSVRIRVDICAIHTGHVLARILILPKTLPKTSSLTINMQVLYIIDQLWCCASEKVRSAENDQSNANMRTRLFVHLT